MNIGHRGGHNEQAQGANGFVNEVVVDRLIDATVDKYLKIDGNETVNCTPGRCESLVDLAYGVNKANAAKVDIFDSNHVNAGGGHGCEVCYVSAKGKVIAERVCAKVVALGFQNRGVKLRTGLYELNNAKAPAIIVEPFFLDTQSDVDIYKKVGADAIGRAIAEGIAGHTIATTSTVTAKVSSYTPVKLGEVTATTLNQRDHASVTSAIVSTFKKGAIVHVYGLVNGFYSVLENKVGKWISADYVKDITPVVVVAPIITKAESNEIYRVVTGSFSDEANADKRIEELKNLGVESFKTVK